MPVAKVLCYAAGDPPSQFTTLGRRRGSGGTEPPLARRREYLNPQSSAPRRTPELEREREMSFLLFCPIKLLLSPVVRGGGADTCTGAGGGTRKTNTYQILHLIHVQHDICGCCAGMGFIVIICKTDLYFQILIFVC